MIVIVDYGMGNLRSVQKALNRLGAESKISSSPADIENAGKIILPGVGHFKNGMENLSRLGLIEPLNKKVLQEKTLVLGICLGMQLMTEFSEEGNTEGLGWIDAKTLKFNLNGSAGKIKVPHMGWNNLTVKKDSPLLKNISDGEQFYFVHSYFVKCRNTEDVLASTVYGNEFVSAFGKENITGMQFHPEKSHSAGLKILSSFCKL